MNDIPLIGLAKVEKLKAKELRKKQGSRKFGDLSDKLPAGVDIDAVKNYFWDVSFSHFRSSLSTKMPF